MLLENKVVLVTGSTTGIGEAIARRAVQEGARVMIHGLEEAWARRVCEDLGQDVSDFVIADIGDPAACERLVDETVSRFGHIDGLVNNAATMKRSNLDTTDADVFDFVVNINLRAPLLIARAAVHAFRRQRTGGSIVNIGSINWLSGEPNLLAYSAAKGGLVTVTRNLANALGPEGIRVNQINPGWVPTPNEIALKISEGLSPDWHETLPRHYAPSGRMTQPAEIASHVVFWLSPQSAPASGIVYEAEQYSPYGRNTPKAF
jgi:NAD(P)-dependent dehydrogenase (short-subunit alcohol dehydrogenase family)